MTLTFYPHGDDMLKGSLADRIEILMEAAERYKAVVIEVLPKPDASEEAKKRMTPRDLKAAFNWEEIARVLLAVRELPEMNKSDKLMKASLLKKLAEVYEVLRAAKMSKLEAVRLALINESNQLGGNSTQMGG
ncbi:MAG: hypothetical protein H0W64_07725 [Gammaproteobacteria bacterium]|nr:hypothetical protein [Gammaproteobacteria bacterium]